MMRPLTKKERKRLTKELAEWEYAYGWGKGLENSAQKGDKLAKVLIKLVMTADEHAKGVRIMGRVIRRMKKALTTGMVPVRPKRSWKTAAAA
jgi:hypothetical protein